MKHHVADTTGEECHAGPSSPNRWKHIWKRRFRNARSRGSVNANCRRREGSKRIKPVFSSSVINPNRCASRGQYKRAFAAGPDKGTNPKAQNGETNRFPVPVVCAWLMVCPMMRVAGSKIVPPSIAIRNGSINWPYFTPLGQAVSQDRQSRHKSKW